MSKISVLLEGTCIVASKRYFVDKEIQDKLETDCEVQEFFLENDAVLEKTPLRAECIITNDKEKIKNYINEIKDIYCFLIDGESFEWRDDIHDDKTFIELDI